MKDRTAGPHLVDISEPAKLAAWASVIGVSERALAAAVARARRRPAWARHAINGDVQRIPSALLKSRQ